MVQQTDDLEREETDMTTETEATQEQDLTPEQLKDNRRINYFVMRYMWQVVRHRGTFTLYDALDTSRERYTRIINTGEVRFKSGELDKWHSKTGISRDIFQGKTVFNCSFSDESNNIQTISKEKWEELFLWRNEFGCDNTGKSIQKEVCSMLEKIPQSDKNNTDFYSMCYFFKKLEPVPSIEPDELIREIGKSLKRLSFSLLDGCGDKQLEEIQKILKDKYNTALRIYNYRQEKNKSKK